MSPQPVRDPDAVAAARKRARRTVWVLALAAVALYAWVILTGGGMR